MKRILSVILVTLLACVFAVSANAEAINMSGGCKVEVKAFEADPVNVIKDGVIGDNEYIEIAVNRDPATTDLLFSWNGDSTLFAKCEEFLKNVHFYFSWDKVHGLNVAVKATLLETPFNESELPAPGTGDEFLFQFGMMCSVVKTDDMTSDVMYRGISKNTVTGELLIGDYGAHGYKGNADIKPNEDFTVAIDGNTVTYEISYPLDAVLESVALNEDGTPVPGSVIHMNISAVGGSLGKGADGAAPYAVSLGDGGYMTAVKLIEEASPVKVEFMSDPIESVGQTTPVDTAAPDTTAPETTVPVTDEDAVTTPAPTQPATTEVVTEVVTSQVAVTNEAGETETDSDGQVVTEVVSEVVTSVVTEAPTQSAGGNNAPVTADPMVIAAVVAAISACGAVVAKKRK